MLVTLASPQNSPASALALGEGTLATSMRSSSPQPDRVDHARPFTLAYPPESSRSGKVKALVNGRSYLTKSFTASRPAPRFLRAVLRTSSAFVDRRSVYFAIQLRDGVGNVKVSTSGVAVTAILKRGTLSKSISCALGGISQASSHFMGHCASVLPEQWFDTYGSATAQVKLTHNGALVDSHDAGVISLRGKPSWHGQLASVLSAAGAFAVLPVSPVYEREQFTVSIYAHTGGFELETFGINLLIDTSRLEYMGFSQNNAFNSVVFSSGGAGNSRLSFSVVGTASSTQPSQATSALAFQNKPTNT